LSRVKDGSGILFFFYRFEFESLSLGWERKDTAGRPYRHALSFDCAEPNWYDRHSLR
jgi:hypothetical protein